MAFLKFLGAEAYEDDEGTGQRQPKRGAAQSVVPAAIPPEVQSALVAMKRDVIFTFDGSLHKSHISLR